MPKSPRTELFLLLLVGVCFLHAAWAQTPPTTVAVRHIQVLGSKNVVEIEIEASDRVVPETRVLTGPDRLVVDIPNAVPGNQLRSQSVNRGEVKDVRVGLFQANPPTTRVVLDLNSPQSYQIFPYGRTVIIKVTGVAQQGPLEVDDFPPVTRPGLVAAAYVAEPVRAGLPPHGLEVTFNNGLLSIRANKATLSEVLFAVHQRTGADVAIASGAEQEKVVADFGPAPAAEVLANLLRSAQRHPECLRSKTRQCRADLVQSRLKTTEPVRSGFVSHDGRNNSRVGMFGRDLNSWNQCSRDISNSAAQSCVDDLRKRVCREKDTDRYHRRCYAMLPHDFLLINGGGREFRPLWVT